MSNGLLTISMVTSEALEVIENNLVMARKVNRKYSDEYAKEGAKIGQTVNVRLPSQFVGRRGPAINIEDDTEISVPVTLTTQYGVDVEFSSQELTLSLSDFKERVLVPQMANIVNNVDSDGCQLYYDIPNLVGTPGTPPATFAVLLAVSQRMNEEAVPSPRRFLVLDPRANASLVGGLSTLFNKKSSLDEQYGSGNMVDVAGLGVDMDQNIYTHTVGPLGGTPLVNGASQGLVDGWSDTGSLITNGWTAAAALRLRRGDVFTLANVFAVNPQNRRSTNVLKQFVVTADTSSDASGNATIPIGPAIIYGGPYQNVTNAPANAAALTIVGTASTGYPQAIGFHKDTFAFVTADLVLPGGVDMAARKTYRDLSMRLVRAYDINNDRFPSRFDLLGGWKTLRRGHGVRLTG